MSEVLTVDGGTIAYEVTGSGPLVVLAHGMGDSRDAYRFVVPELVSAGYRVAAVDLRGCGESSVDWPGYTRTDIAGDLIALVEHLGGPAVLVGHSISGGAVTIAAAKAPESIRGIVELGPFTRKQSVGLGDLRVKRFRTAMARLAMATTLGSVRWWHKYLDLAFPTHKPADWADQLQRNEANLNEPGRMKTLQRMGRTTPVDAGDHLDKISCPALIVQGSLDPDWADPRAEGEAIVAAMPTGLGRLEIIEGAGHYPHTEFPAETVAVLLPFLHANANA